MNTAETQSTFDHLDVNKDGGIQYKEFEEWWLGIHEVDEPKTPLLRRMNSLRESIAKKHSLFFGFTYEMWKKAANLDFSRVAEVRTFYIFLLYL